MNELDRLGRRRHPLQGRGLRPLFPKLPADVLTRSLRIAMSDSAWQRLDALTEQAVAPTRPRAIGAVVERALASLGSERPNVSLRGVCTDQRLAHADWLSWQAEKEQRLIGLH